MMIALRGKPTEPGKADGCSTTKTTSAITTEPAARDEMISTMSATVGYRQTRR